jgi:integrase
MRTDAPSYRLHRASGQAVVTLAGADHYLGKFGSTESRERYDRLIAEWLANGRMLTPGADITVAEVMVRYLRFAAGYYVKDGRPTSELGLIRYALKPLKDLYGSTPARDFGPLALKAVRQTYIDANLCRHEVNRRTGLVVRFFKWAVENELAPASIHHGLQAVAGLRRGRCDVREAKPVGPVPELFVEAIEPYVNRQVWAMVQLQRVTGMRPGEVCIMRTADLDVTGSVWVYIPERHKMEHHGRSRQVYIGPQGQAILRPWLRTDLKGYLFSPADAMAERRTDLRGRRKTRVQPSQQNRRKLKPEKTPGTKYTTDSYRQAIAKACDKAGIAHWHPNQLRHNAATRLRREFGVDVARIILGHSSPIVTEIYAELDREKALAVVGKIG